MTFQTETMFHYPIANDNSKKVVDGRKPEVDG